MTWFLINGRDVIPADDLRPHQLRDCWCKPTPDDEEPTVIVHHAMDGREAFESGERLSS